MEAPAQNTTPRNNMVMIIAGTRGTGKTHYTKRIIEAQKKNFKKTIVVDTFDSPPWRTMHSYTNPEGIHQVVPRLTIEQLPFFKSGIVRVFGSDMKHIQKMVEHYVYNTFVVYEDATKFIGSKLTEDFKRFVYDTKQKGIDIVFIFHSIMAIPPDLIRCSDVIKLFKTGESYGQVKSKIGHVPNVKEKMEKLAKSDNRYITETLILN